MKKAVFVLGSALVIMLTACSKDDNNGITVTGTRPKPYDG